MDPLSCFPLEVTIRIFSYFDLPILQKCCQVSKEWKKIAECDLFWKKYLGDLVPLEEKLKDFVCKRSIRTIKGLKNRMELFFQGLKINEWKNFRCIFPFDPQMNMTITSIVKDHQWVIPSKEEELWIFTQKRLLGEMFEHTFATVCNSENITGYYKCKFIVPRNLCASFASNVFFSLGDAVKRESEKIEQAKRKRWIAGALVVSAVFFSALLFLKK